MYTIAAPTGKEMYQGRLLNHEKAELAPLYSIIKSPSNPTTNMMGSKQPDTVSFCSLDSLEVRLFSVKVMSL